MSRPRDPETTRLTITLPRELVRELDERLREGDDSRAATIRHLIKAALREREVCARRMQRLHEMNEQYVRGWREQPSTVEEFGRTTSPSILKHLTAVPWDFDEEPSGGPTSRAPGDVDPLS